MYAIFHPIHEGDGEIYFYRTRSGLEVDIFHAAERVTGKSIIAVEAERRPGDPPIAGGSSDKARKILNREPEYPGPDEIIKTVWLPQSAGIGKEADFLIRQGQHITAALQVCQDIGAAETWKREIAGALAAAAPFGQAEAKILTADREHEEIHKGVRILYEPVWRWLVH
jgi:hypothetical protein